MSKAPKQGRREGATQGARNIDDEVAADNGAAETGQAKRGLGMYGAELPQLQKYI